MKSTVYDEAFYADQEKGSFEAAMVVMPIITSLVPVTSLVDIGCGVGTWLSAARILGVVEIDGYDGDYVDRSRLRIDIARFHASNLLQDFSLSRQYDVALSLEVAEHLPASESDGFVAMLTETAPVVVFSAAIPGQGGTDHVNEQWQDEWRKLFAKRGFHPFDCIRPLIRGNPSVPWWYQQNIIVYCRTGVTLMDKSLRVVPDEVSLNIVHPVLYDRKLQLSNLYLSKALTLLPGLVYQAVRNRFQKAPFLNEISD